MFPRKWFVLSSLAVSLGAGFGVYTHALAEQPSGIVLVGLATDRQPVVDSRSAGGEHGNAADDRQLGEFLVGTKWLMYEIPGRIAEFGENGKFELEDWKQQGIEARWKVTGPKQVTVTVISQKFRNLKATLNFDNRLSYFTGTDLDHKRQITKSPRINSVPNDPADPNRH
jgi:hypothetical protein